MKTKDYFDVFFKHASKLFGEEEIVIDCGTAITRIGICNKGIVLREPTFVGQNTKTNEYFFFGTEAKEIYGKAPNAIAVIQPIESSIISDFDSGVALAKYFIGKSVHPFFSKNRIIKTRLSALTTTPASATEVEQKALVEMLTKADCGSVKIIEKPIATAAGAQLPIFSKNPVFIIDIGAGQIEMSIIVMGGIVVYKAIKNAGHHMDKLLSNYLHLKNGIIIGDQTAEQLKIALFSFEDTDKQQTIRGKSLESGLPKSIRVRTSEVKEALTSAINGIIDGAKELIETVPPEIIDGIVKSGITLAGGGARIKGLDRYMTTELKIPVYTADNPEDCTINGLLSLCKDTVRLDRLLIE